MILNIPFVLLVLCIQINSVFGSPEQITLTLSASYSEMVISWADINGVAADGVCEYGTSVDNLDSIVSATGQTYTYLSYTSPMLYKAVMTGLKAGNNIYYYRVGSAATGYSDIKAFKSHPGVGQEKVVFHLLGDLGQTNNSISTLNELLAAEAALTDAYSGGIIHMGDLSYANGNEPLWDTFANLKQFATQTVPFVTTLGNHEWFDDVQYSFKAYLARYDNPTVNGKRELYYSFDSGLVHWVMVAGYCPEMKSTSTQPCLAEGSAQMTWLQSDLQNVDRSVTPWVFVAFHEPYINSNTAHNIASEGLPMQKAIEDTLYQNKVDVVFSGHVHAYERSCRGVYQYACVDNAPMYITIGDGGNAEGLATGWVSPQPAWSAFRQASYGFGEATVMNATHVKWEWHQNQDLFPTVADSLWIIKSESVDKTPHGVTKEPRFMDGVRGKVAAKFNEAMLKAHSSRD